MAANVSEELLPLSLEQKITSLKLEVIYVHQLNIYRPVEEYGGTDIPAIIMRDILAFKCRSRAFMYIGGRKDGFQS